MKLLKQYLIENNSVYLFKSGCLSFWIKNIAKEWMIAYSHKDSYSCNNEPILSEKPEDTEWARIMVRHSSGKIVIKPAMPEKPVVVQSHEEIRIPEKQESVIWVRIPMNYRIFAGSGKDELMLAEIPSEIMSKTWFGDLQTGMLAYSLNTNIITDADYEEFENHVSCRILITNSSKKPFAFRKLSIPANNMNIYLKKTETDSFFLTDSLLVDYSDDDRIKITLDDAVSKKGNNNIVFEAQKSIQDKYILVKGVTSFIKTVTGLSGV